MYLDKNGLNVIIKVSRNAKGIEGTSNLMKADREQPVGGKAHVGCPGMIRRNHWTAVIREEPGREMAPCPALRDE